MRQNTSSAVMAQRQEARDSLDDFPTPPWAVRALCEALWEREHGPFRRALDPAAGRGWLARGLRDYFPEVDLSDVHDYGCDIPVDDFLFPNAVARDVDWLVTNPPFRLAVEFVAKARQISTGGVAMLLRSVWTEGVERHATIFTNDPPDLILQFAGRVVMQKSIVRDPDLPFLDIDPKTGKLIWKRPSTATSYSWFVWTAPPGPRPTTFGWIPDVRRDLTRPDDYQPPLSTVRTGKQAHERLLQQFHLPIVQRNAPSGHGDRHGKADAVGSILSA